MRADLTKLPTFKLRVLVAKTSGAEREAAIAELSRRGIDVTANW